MAKTGRVILTTGYGFRGFGVQSVVNSVIQNRLLRAEGVHAPCRWEIRWAGILSLNSWDANLRLS